MPRRFLSTGPAHSSMPESRKRKKKPPAKPSRPPAPETHLDFELKRRREPVRRRERFLAARRIFLAEQLGVIQQQIDIRGMHQDLGFLLMVLYIFNFIREDTGPENADAVLSALAFTGWPLDDWRHLPKATSLEEMAALIAADSREAAGAKPASLKALLLDAWESFGLGETFAPAEVRLTADARDLYEGIGGEADRQRQELIESLRRSGGPRRELRLHTLGIVPTELCPNSCRFCLVPLKLSLAERGAGAGVTVFAAEAAAWAAARGMTLVITGGEPLLELETVTGIISAAPGRVELTTSCSWATGDRKAEKILKRLYRAHEAARAASPAADFILQLSLDAFHQEMRRAGARDYRENIPLENVARVVATALTAFPGLKLALLGKYTLYPDPVAELLRLLAQQGWEWRFLKKSFHAETTVSAADGQGRIRRRPALRHAWLKLKSPEATGKAAPLPVFLLYGQVESMGRASLLKSFEYPTHDARTAAFAAGDLKESCEVTGLEIGDEGNVYPEAYAAQAWALGNLNNESLDEIVARAEYDPLLIALAEAPERILELARAHEPALAAARASSPMALVYAALRRADLRLEITRALAAGRGQP